MDQVKSSSDRSNMARKSVESSDDVTTPAASPPGHGSDLRTLTLLKKAHVALCVFVLLINYFLAQYDKFILSYFQLELSRSLDLSTAQYGILSGYATGIVYALAALPIAYLADYLPSARVWVLTVAALWWSLCVIFQSLAKNFTQLLLARIAMGIGQSVVEPLSVSLISDMFSRRRTVFIGESVLFVGVYIGEAISGQIATAFSDNQAGWRIALRAIGITGMVVAVALRIIVRDNTRIPSAVATNDELDGHDDGTTSKPHTAMHQLRGTFHYLLRMRSFWLIAVSASFRQLAGNVFGYYMPTYLSTTFSTKLNLLSRYGIIVGVVGSVAVLSGGILTRLLWDKTKMTPLYLTACGGMISSLFVLLIVFSLDIAHGNQQSGVHMLYGFMSVAYLTAELWLGALNGLVALILPPRYKTFGLAIYSASQVLIYSSGPEIIGLALPGKQVGREAYLKDLQVILAVMISVCYWIAGVGFLCTVPLLKQDLDRGVDMDTKLSKKRKLGFAGLSFVVGGLVIGLFIASIYFAAEG